MTLVRCLPCGRWRLGQVTALCLLLTGGLTPARPAAAAAPEAPAHSASSTGDAAAAFSAGRQALAAAVQFTATSRQALFDAAALRRALASRRSAGATGAVAAEDTARLETLQRQGAEARDRADAARREAVAHFAQGLRSGWPQWVRDSAPLTLDSDLRQALDPRIAHNARVRSVHPNMPPAVADTITQPASAPLDEAFTLQFPMLASQNPPRDLDIASFQLSRDARFVAHIEVDTGGDGAVGSPTGAAAVPLNRLHRWRLLVSDLQGAPVKGARIEVGGHMPGHVHGLPTQPRVTGEVAPGVYRVEGLKFQMDGWWVMQFEIQPAAGPAGGVPAPDNVAFNLVF